MVKISSPQTNIIFFGTSSYAVPALLWLINHGYKPSLVITQPDKPIGRSQTITAPVIKEIAKKHIIKLLQPINLDQTFKIALQGQRVQVGIVAAYGRILPEWLLTIPQLGLLNLHPSLLPEYRGPSPIQSVIRDGARQTGNTLMKIDNGMDTGPILGQQSVAIDLRDTTQTLEKKLGVTAPLLLERYLSAYLAGQINPSPQLPGGSVTKLIKKVDGKIDWTLSADKIEQMYRAYDPWPGLWTNWRGRTVKLADIRTSDKTQKAPGSVFLDDTTLHITCGRGSLIIGQLQREGKKIQSVTDWLNGYKDFVGSVLGS